MEQMAQVLGTVALVGFFIVALLHFLYWIGVMLYGACYVLSGKQPPPPKWRSYDEFLTSDEWAEMRRVCLERAGGRCERCGAPATQAHHKTYRRTWLMTRWDDLEALCRQCHRKEHEPEWGQGER